MPISVFKHRLPRITAVALLFACATFASRAEQVYKCNVGGKITYQAAPCKEGKADQVETHSNLSEAEMKAAQERADREKFAAASASPSSGAPTQQSAAPMTKGKADCGALSAQRTQAYARRNAALASARQGDGVTAGSAGDVAIAGLQAEVQSIESRMHAGGCSY